MNAGIRPFIEIKIQDLERVKKNVIDSLEQKSPESNNYLSLFQTLVEAINTTLMDAEEEEYKRTFSGKEMDSLERACESTMEIAIDLHNKFLSKPDASILGIENVVDQYYELVKNVYNHKIETDPMKVKRELSRRPEISAAKPHEIVASLQAMGKRLDPNLNIPIKMSWILKYFLVSEELDQSKNEIISQLNSYSGEIEEIQWAAVSYDNYPCRDSMEDTYAVVKFEIEQQQKKAVPVSMFGLYDGHGGSTCSTFLGNYLHQIIKEELDCYSSLSEINIYNALKLSFVRAHDQFTLNSSQSGSTAIVALFINEDLWIANVGDTRAVLSNGGIPIQLTEDQKPTSETIREGIYRRGGRVSGGRIYATFGSLGPGRAIGDPQFRGVNPRPKLTKIPLSEIKSGSWLVLACDGLWDVLGSHEAVQLISHEIEPSSVAKKLVMEAINLWSTDNITVLAIKCP